MKKNKIISFYLGESSRKFMLRSWVPLFSLFFWSMIIISGLFYPEELHYSIFKDNISAFGDIAINTFPGWLFFTIAMISIAVMGIPMVNYVYYHFKSMSEKYAKIANSFFLIGVSLMIPVGLISQTSSIEFLSLPLRVYHNIIAVIGFFCVGTASVIYGFFYHVDNSSKYKGKHLLQYKKMTAINIYFSLTAI